jgi:chorismate-pyruvate lyase
MDTEDLLSKILAVPVGQVVDVLSEILNCNIDLQIIEQNTVSPHKFIRKISISANEIPVLKAHVKFDSTVLPKFILDELLKKEQGIGTILTQNNISASRNIISVNHNFNENKVSREYEVLKDGTVWFTILEEIRLAGLGANNNC